MKIWCSAAVGMAVTIATCVAQAAGNIPSPCTGSGYEPPVSFHCPVPYVEMQPPRNDKGFTKAWHCRETGHSLGIPLGGSGCGGSAGLDMFPGWVVPAQAPVETNAYTEEFDNSVLNPCLRESMKNYSVFSQMDDDAALTAR